MTVIIFAPRTVSGQRPRRAKLGLGLVVVIVLRAIQPSSIASTNAMATTVASCR